jgi:cellulose synthase/poly-beta-1,6-N-acetylglucosamine synthase-like glycosyltransferase
VVSEDFGESTEVYTDLTVMELASPILSLLRYLATALLWAIVLWSFLIVLNYKNKGVDNNFFPKISLMTYAWQSGNVIERKICNFLEQEYPKDRIEIIVYDNNSTDETEKICRKYEKKGLIKYFRTEKHFEFKAPVLDEAIDAVSTGDFILFTDPDGVCERTWARKMIQPFADNKVGAVVGAIHCGNYYRNIFTRFRAIEDEWATNIVVFGRNGKIRLSRLNLISGANYALRRTAWESVGKSHGESIVEDIQMGIRLYGKKWIIESANANLWQEEVEGPKEYLRQRRRWYQFTNDLIGNTHRIERFLGLLPLTLQSAMFLSFLYIPYSVGLLISGLNMEIDWGRLFLFSVFILGNILLAIGLKKVGKTKLIPYVLPYFIVDGALQLYCFLEVRLGHVFVKRSSWPKLTDGKYYHIGTPIRTD